MGSLRLQDNALVGSVIHSKIEKRAKTAKRTDDRGENTHSPPGPVKPLSHPVDVGEPDTELRDNENRAATKVREYLTGQAKKVSI